MPLSGEIGSIYYKETTKFPNKSSFLSFLVLYYHFHSLQFPHTMAIYLNMVELKCEKVQDLRSYINFVFIVVKSALEPQANTSRPPQGSGK